MKHVMKICLLVLIIVAINGCGVLSKEPYRQIKYYDIGQPAKLAAGNYNIDIAMFTTTGPYRSKMIYRTEGCRLHFDEYNKWVQAPNIMLSRFLQEAFVNDMDSHSTVSYKVVGELIGFNINLDKQNVSITVEYEIYDTKLDKLVLHKTLTLNKNFQENTPKQFAQAFNTVCNQLAQKINLSLQTLSLESPTKEGK